MDANFIPQYAAQAVIDLESQAKVAKRLRDGRHHVLAMLAQIIRDAVHIVLPNRGEIYRPNTGMSSIPTSDECASFDGLPAPVSCFEYPWSYDFKPDSRLVDFGDEANKATKRITLVIDGKQMEASNAEAQRLVGAPPGYVGYGEGGMLTEAVQVLAGVLLPSATVFLLLLCNDRHILGPWINSTRLNLFTGAVVAGLVMLSVILTAAVLFPDLSEAWIIGILVGGSALAVAVTALVKLYEMSSRRHASFRFKRHQPPLFDRDTWY